MTGYPNDQGNAAGAIPVYIGGGTPENIAASQLTQIKSEAGILQGLSINTAGVGSSAAFFDGLSHDVTISIATPGVVSYADHPFVAGSKVRLSTTGALPTGLAVATDYYVIAAGLTADAFELSATPGGAAIDTSGSQSGVQTIWDLSHALGAFATTAQNSLALNIAFENGLIALTADGGTPADITAVYR